MQQIGGVWLPAQVEHVGLNRHAASYCSLYVSEALCAALPSVLREVNGALPLGARPSAP